MFLISFLAWTDEYMILEKIIRDIRLGYRVSKKDIVKNVFSTNNSKKALLCYITSPYKNGQSRSHTNFLECATWAELLSENEFNVDVTDWMEQLPQDVYHQYSLIAGLGRPFRDSFFNEGAELRKHVFYGTMAYPLFSNALALDRVCDLRKSTGRFFLDSCRLVPESFQVSTRLSDRLIILGNDFTKNTYREALPKNDIVAINLFYHRVDATEALASANWAERKRNILWFGSGGLVHKGLDIAIECARRVPYLKLHVCGPLVEEKFSQTFLSNIPSNVQLHGFVDIDSQKFLEILSTCGAVLHPSLSEGQAGSVITVCGNGGLIPIITKQTGLDTNGLGFEFDYPSLAMALEKIEEYFGTCEYDLAERSRAIIKYFEKMHSYEMYRINLKRALSPFVASL
jgi:glycosyltransferase involved in cell wall biosynthesis